MSTAVMTTANRLSHTRRLLVCALTCIGATAAYGCGCGLVVAPDGANDAGVASTANVVDGVVTFAPVDVGSSETLEIPVKDTADSNETITGASLTGSGSGDFQVLSTFPMPVPAGKKAVVQIEFAPQSTGQVSAQLILQTAAMGPSPISLAGTGLSATGK